MVNMNVPVPAGHGPGNTLTVVTPSGQSVSVTIPAGVAAGGTFQISVPDNMAAAVPTAVPAQPVPASIVPAAPVVGQAVSNSGLAPMETSVSRGPPQPTQRVKQAKEAVFCTSAATMVLAEADPATGEPRPGARESELRLAPGSLYVLADESRYDFAHAIAPEGRRLSIVLRDAPADFEQRSL